MPPSPFRRFPRFGGALFAAVLAMIATAAAQTAPPQRAVVIGGVLTEIIYALGAQDRVAAVDISSTWPVEALQQKPNVGYMRQLSAEGVLTMAPDHIVALAGSGPQTALDLLTRAGIPVTIIQEGYTPAAVAANIRRVGALFGRAAEADALADRVLAEIDEVQAALAGLDRRPTRVLFVLSFAGGRIVAAGRNTAADAIIRLAGAENAMSGIEGYLLVSDESVTISRPDTVLVMNNGGPEVITDAVFGLPALIGTPAGTNRSFLSFDAQLLLGFGPRTAEAIRALAVALYPELRPALMPEAGTAP